MNAEQENRLSDRLNALYLSIGQLENAIIRKNQQIKILQQENEELKKFIKVLELRKYE